MSNRTLIVCLAAAAAVLAGISAGAFFLRPHTPELVSGTLLDERRPVADFALTGDDGRPFTRDDLRGHWNIVYAGYTYCPDVCPTTLADLESAVQKLGARASSVRVVFISVDPERDTPQRLAQYVHYFDPAFRAATGSTPALEALGTSLGFVFAKVPGATPQSYLMDHSAALMLIDPQGRLAGYLTPPFKSEAIAGDLTKILDGAS